jgi:sugar lactone lactonase YvrE
MANATSRILSLPGKCSIRLNDYCLTLKENPHKPRYASDWGKAMLAPFVGMLLISCQMASSSRLADDPVKHYFERSQRLVFDGQIAALAFSRGGSALIIGGCQASDAGSKNESLCAGGVIQVWNLQEVRPEKTITFPQPVTAVAMSPDGGSWVAGDMQGRLLLSTATRIPKPFHQKGKINALAFSPQGRWVVSGSADASFPLGFLDTQTGGVIKVTTQFEPVSALAFSPDGKTVVVGMTSGRLVTWDYSSRSMPVSLIPRKTEQRSVTSVTFSPDGLRVAYGMIDGKVRIIELGSKEVPVEYKAGSAINALAFSPDGRYLAIAQDNGKVVLIDSSQGTEISSKRHTLSVSDLAYSPDGMSLAVAAQQNIYLYQVGKQTSLTRSAGQPKGMDGGPRVWSGLMDKNAPTQSSISSEKVVGPPVR